MEGRGSGLIKERGFFLGYVDGLRGSVVEMMYGENRRMRIAVILDVSYCYFFSYGFCFGGRL